MKSIESVSGGVVRSMRNQAIQPITETLVSRAIPLDAPDIAKLDGAISGCFLVSSEPVYGYAPKKDDAGNVIRQEFDVVSYQEKYEQTAPVPAQLRDAMLRPAKSQHIIFHLSRLAAHRRDTRGKEALQAVLEDLSGDLEGVPEWAVITACREIRKKRETWYPTTGEIIHLIRKHEEILKVALDPSKEMPKPPALVHQKPAEQTEPSRREKAKKDWCDADWQDYVAEAERMIALAEKSGGPLNPDLWKTEVENRTKQWGEAKARLIMAG